MPLKIKRREGSPFWWLSGTINGQRYRESTGTCDRTEAEKIRAIREAEIWRSAGIPSTEPLTFAEAAVEYLEAGKSTRYLTKVIKFWNDKPVEQITGAHVREAARKLYPNCSAATWNRQVLVPTSAVINYAAEKALCSPLKVKRFSEDKTERTPATPEWVNAFVSKAPPHTGAACLFMFCTGARISETLSLTWENVSLSEGRATITHAGKGQAAKVTRSIALPSRVIAALANIPSDRQPSERVFGYKDRHGIVSAWKATIKRAKIEALSPHCCRHGFATFALRNGVDPKTIAKEGGWKSARLVLDLYAHALDDRTGMNALFDTQLAQNVTETQRSPCNERKIK